MYLKEGFRRLQKAPFSYVTPSFSSASFIYFFLRCLNVFLLFFVASLVFLTVVFFVDHSVWAPLKVTTPGSWFNIQVLKDLQKRNVPIIELQHCQIFCKCNSGLFNIGGLWTSIPNQPIQTFIRILG